MKKLKKRTIIVLLAVILIFAAAAITFSFWKQPLKKEVAPKKTPIHLVAMGDSLTEGIGDETKAGGYVGIIKEDLARDKQVTKITTKNYGVMGNKIDQLSKRFNTQPNFQKDVKQANIITITIGGNDVMKILKSRLLNTKVSDFSTGNKHFQKQLKDLLKAIRKENSRAPIYLVGIYNPYTTYFGDIKEFEEIISAWNAKSKETLQTVPNAHFIPIADKIETFDKKWQNKPNPLLAKDHFHPNRKGYEKIATALEKSIRKQLRANKIPLYAVK